MKRFILVIIAELCFFFFTSVPANATIIILVSTYDGFIIAADSRLTLSDKERDRIASDSYQKIFRIGHSSGLAFAGTALLVDLNNQKRSIGSIVEAFKIHEKISDSTKISPELITNRLKIFFEQIYNAHRENIFEGTLAIIVFGYDEQNIRRIYELDFPKEEKSSTGSPTIVGVITPLFTSGTPGCYVLGQQDVWHRIIKGYDPSLDDINFSKEKRDSLRYDIRYELMSIQDGIDFSVFIVRATIEAQRFNQKSVMGVGGAIDVATITTHGFEWIQKKKLNVEGKESDYRE